ncbi:MAG: hypothetical protein ABSC57_11490 [Syntrophales bacterium]
MFQARPCLVHNTVDIRETSFAKWIFLMASAGALLLRSLYCFQDGRMTIVVLNILFYVGFAIAEAITDQFHQFPVNSIS